MLRAHLLSTSAVLDARDRDALRDRSARRGRLGLGCRRRRRVLGRNRGRLARRLGLRLRLRRRFGRRRRRVLPRLLGRLLHVLRRNVRAGARVVVLAVTTGCLALGTGILARRVLATRFGVAVGLVGRAGRLGLGLRLRLDRRLARAVGALPRRNLGDPVEVTAVNEDASTVVVVQTDDVAVLVVDKGQQGHADHGLLVEVVTHDGRLLGSGLEGVHDIPIAQDRQLLDRGTDGLLHLGGDVARHAGPDGPFGCGSHGGLALRRLGGCASLGVVDLDSQRVGHLTGLRLVVLGELQNVVPVEASLLGTSVQPVDEPLLAPHSLHQVVPGKGQRVVAERVVQQRRGRRVVGRVGTERLLRVSSPDNGDDLGAAVGVLHANRAVLRGAGRRGGGRGFGRRRRRCGLAGRVGTHLQGSNRRSDNRVVGRIVDSPLGQRVTLSRVGQGIGGRGDGAQNLSGRVSTETVHHGRVGQVDRVRRVGSGRARAAPGKGGHEHQDADHQAGLDDARHSTHLLPSWTHSCG